MLMCPADAAGCSDVAVVGVLEIVVPLLVAAVVIAIFVFFAARRRRR